MKKIFFAAVVTACSISLLPCAALAQKTIENAVAVSTDPLEFKKDLLDLKEIPQGKPVTVEFEYTNNSNKAVLIKNVQPTCGCTIAAFDKASILPGKTGKITATYNAAGMGVFSKSLIVEFSDDQRKTLTLKGTVI